MENFISILSVICLNLNHCFDRGVQKKSLDLPVADVEHFLLGDGKPVDTGIEKDTFRLNKTNYRMAEATL